MSARSPSTRAWAWLDQGLASLGNFASTLIIARGLPTAEFGVFAVIFAALLVLNTFQAALVTFPLSIRGPALGRRELAALTSTALLATWAVSAVLACLACVMVWSTGRLTLVPVVVAALFFGQMHETTRAAFFAHFRQRDAIAGDALSYLGQAAILFALSQVGWLSPESAFLVIAVTSGAAFALQAVQLRLPLPRARGWNAFVGDAIRFGTWGLPARIGTLFSAQAFPWVLFYSHGAAAAAAFQVMTSAVAFTNPVMIGTANLVTTTVASGRGAQRFARAFRHAWHGWALVAPFLLLVVLFPATTLRLLYGANPTYAANAGVLWMMVAACACEAVVIQATAVIGGAANTRTLFMMQATGLGIAVAFGLPLAVYGGVRAALCGYLAVQIGRVLFAVRAWSSIATREPLHLAGATA